MQKAIISAILKSLYKKRLITFLEYGKISKKLEKRSDL